jgi:chitodextrinase
MAFEHRPRVRGNSSSNNGNTLESLEDRRLFAVSLGSDGWTDVDPSADTRAVYVSSSGGSDTNSGLSAGAPVKTLAKARTLLRDGSPDWMLLKRGDAWSENLSTWTHSGRSQQEPMVIGTYGTGERPKLNTGTSIGFKNADQVSHLAVLGVHFHAHTRDTESSSYNGTTAGNYGMNSLGRLDDVLFEDVVFDDYTYNLSVTGYDSVITDFRLRRSIVTDAWSTSGKAQGMYVHRTSGMVLEENLFDHNGWNGDVSGAQQNIYSHGIYMSWDNSDVVVRGNIISDSSSHGLQARSGGVIENNVFLRNPINLLFGGGAPTVHPGGVSGRVSGNVFLDSRSINGSGRGTGLELSNLKPGANVTVTNNIFTGDTHRNASAITFGTTSDATNLGESMGINDLTIRDNIVYDWYSAWSMGSSFVLGGSGNLGVNNVKVDSNDFQNAAVARLVRHGPSVNKSELAFTNNRYDNHDAFSSSGWFQVGSTTTSMTTWKANVESTAQTVAPAYANPVRSIAGYNVSIGGSASLGDFVAGAAEQVRGAFEDDYSAAAVINYVRRGFAEGGVVPGGLLPLPTSGAVPGGDPGPTEPPPPTGDTSPPTPPNTLRATGASDTTVGMTWNASTDNVGVAGYEIFRAGVKIATTTGTTYTDTGLTPSTAYVYTVRAFDAAGNYSSSSNNDTGTTLAPAADSTAPTAPANLAVGAVTTSSVALSWTAATDNKGVAGYRVFRNGVQVASVTGTSYTDTGLAAATGYGYTVKAYDAAGNVSAASNGVTGTTATPTEPTPQPPPAPTVPAAPMGITITKVQRKARLTWADGSSNEAGFYVYSSTDGVNWTRLATMAANAGTGESMQYTTGTLRGTRYFRVTAFNAAGESTPTDVVQIII